MERKAGHQLLVRNLIATFPGLPAPVLDIPCLEINSGERVALMGPSGSGKTTLINILTGMALPTNGEVFWGGGGGRKSLPVSGGGKGPLARLQCGADHAGFPSFSGAERLGQCVIACWVALLPHSAAICGTRPCAATKGRAIPPGSGRGIDVPRGDAARCGCARVADTTRYRDCG